MLGDTFSFLTFKKIVCEHGKSRNTEKFKVSEKSRKARNYTALDRAALDFFIFGDQKLAPKFSVQSGDPNALRFLFFPNDLDHAFFSTTNRRFMVVHNVQICHSIFPCPVILF